MAIYTNSPYVPPVHSLDMTSSTVLSDRLIVHVQYGDPSSLIGVQFLPYDLYPLYLVQTLRSMVSEDCQVHDDFVFLMRNGVILEDHEQLYDNDIVQAVVYKQPRTIHTHIAQWRK